MEGAIAQGAPMVAIVALLAIIGWVFTTWLRVKHGYPLDGAWGQAIYPKTSDEAMERIKLLSSENAQLRASSDRSRTGSPSSSGSSPTTATG
jgi:predicted metal-binding membrane protein